MLHRFCTARVLFSAALATLLAFAAATPAAAAEKYTRGLRYPSLTPDKKAVVFSYRGDIWVADTDGKTPARRLTIHEAQDTLPRVSPDGTQVAFSSQRNGAYDIFVMPITGGVAKQISFHSGIEIVGDWSPDGKNILFVSNRDASKYRLNVYEMPATGGTARRITVDGGRDPSYTPDGKAIVYARGFNTIYQDDYEGSANYDIYTVPVTGGTPTRLLKSQGNERYPFVSEDGKTLYFVAEENKVANFYSIPFDPAAKEPYDGKRTQVTKLTGLDVHRPDLGWDFRTVVYERWGQLFTTELTAEDRKAKVIPLTVTGDVRHSGVAQRTVTSGAEQVDISSDGASMVFSMHGDIWTTAGNGGNATRITSGPQVDEWPRFSPDGTRVAFQSDASGNSDIWLLDLKTRAVRQLTKDKSGDFFHNWSPDGTRLVFCSERSGNRDIWTIDVETGATTRLTNHSAADDDPVYSPDGRSIAFDSGREGNQAVFVMDADGNNVRRVTRGGGFLQVPNFSPDGSLIVYESFNPATGRSGGIYVVSASGGSAMQISRNGQTACWSPRGDYIYFSVGDRGRQEIYRVPAPKTVENREKVPFMGTVEVDLRKELADLFEEAWRRLRDGFYDAKMHGVDWDAMKKKYRDMAVDAEDKTEFQNVVMQMLAELNASHLGIHGGRRSSNAVQARVVPTGYLAVDLSDEVLEGGGRKILSVFPKGPADQAGLRVGDVVTAIDRKPIKASTDVDRLLAGKVGKEVRVRFRPYTEDGLGTQREEIVKPIAAGRYHALRHNRWVSGNASKVAKATKRRVAYIHLDAMNGDNLARFQRAIGNWNQQSRGRRGRGPQALIIDVRENGGGNIHQQLMQVLTARPFAQVQMRGSRARVTQPGLYWDKPVCVLINERSFSDAEVFPYVFQYAGLGKVIGVPTPGGVIGTNDITLSDGTTFRIPRVGYYGMDGTNLERYGVKPDILVEETAEDRLAGRDPQLEAAIKEMMAEVRAAAGKKPVKPEPAKPEPTKPEPTQPSPTPDEKPIPAGAMNPLGDARAGEWVRYKASIPGAPEETMMRVAVSEVRDGVVYFDRETESGPPLPLPLPQEAPQVPLLEGIAVMGRVLNQETLTEEVDGKTAEVVAVTLEAFGGQLKMYFTNAVPCLGLIRVQMGKVVILEASEWGVDEAPDMTPERAPETTPEEAPKPDAQPEPKPEPKPDGDRPRKGGGAGKQPAGPPNPLFDAQPGEWVRLRSIVQGESTIATLRVTEVSDDEVHLESRIAYGGKEIRGAPVRRPRRAQLALGGRAGRGKVAVGQEVLEVNGHRLRCTTITRTSRRGEVTKRWISNDVPVDGLVRQERGGKVVKELLDWGTSGEPPAPPAAR